MTTTNWEEGLPCSKQRRASLGFGQGGMLGAGAAEEAAGCEICPAVPAWVIMPSALDSQDSLQSAWWMEAQGRDPASPSRHSWFCSTAASKPVLLGVWLQMSKPKDTVSACFSTDCKRTAASSRRPFQVHCVLG